MSQNTHTLHLFFQDPCSDEMTESVGAEAFQSRLWDMFPYERYQTLTLPQIDRVRWILFPQVRIPDQASLFDEADMLRVMDVQQEQLARSLGDGHRVIHGVAGSGKTMVLGYRAEYLARAHTAGKPVLVLCYNEPLAVKLAATMAAKGLSERVHCVHFHKWARAQLVAYGQTLPANNQSQDAFFADMVQRVITGVDRGHIPTGQYLAVLIDEGHDFAPEWLKLVTQMVDPATNSLLVRYDDAQSIYERGHKKNFSFKSVGIQAQGRTTILKINYRNTRQILQTANAIAGDLLTAEDRDDDGIPLVKPVSCGRGGPEPIIINLPTLPGLPSCCRVRTLMALLGVTWPCYAATPRRVTCAQAPWPGAVCPCRTVWERGTMTRWPIARLLARKATQWPPGGRASTDRRELCRSSQGAGVSSGGNTRFGAAGFAKSRP